MKKTIYLSIALLVLLTAGAAKSYACSCLASPAPQRAQIENAYQNTDAIFEGKVMNVSQTPGETGKVLIRFKVSRMWKGKSSQEITVSTAAQSEMCGYSFTARKKYLVYAIGQDQMLSTNNCSRTAFLMNQKSFTFAAVEYLKATKASKIRRVKYSANYSGLAKALRFSTAAKVNDF